MPACVRTTFASCKGLLAFSGPKSKIMSENWFPWAPKVQNGVEQGAEKVKRS